MSRINEAKALLQVAEVLDDLPHDIARCKVMAEVCVQLEKWDYARAFIDRAEFLAREIDEELERKAKETHDQPQS